MPGSSTFQASVMPALQGGAGAGSAFNRLWVGFANARIAIGLSLLALLGALHWLGLRAPITQWTLAVVAIYLAAALGVRVLMPRVRRGTAFDPQWVFSIGIDLLVFSTLELLQAGGLSYGALFALPVLMAAMLGSSLLALGTTAGVALLLLAQAWVQTLGNVAEPTTAFLQAGLGGIGYFVLALTVHQLAQRLARVEEAARASRRAALLQVQVNQMVMETLAEGVLVVDARLRLLAANPAARQLLALEPDSRLPGRLLELPGGDLLAELALQTLHGGRTLQQELALDLERAGAPRRLQVRSRLAPVPETGDPEEDALQDGASCLLFLQDLRELQARLRTEKLAAMGRMSTAVAHEIRNPLAAISQANQLLEEELREPGQRRLAALVAQNVLRLSSIVDDILDVARVQRAGGQPEAAALPLDAATAECVQEWASQHQARLALQLVTEAGGTLVRFEAGHLRRVLVNLLDNAARYASGRPGSIQVATGLEDEHTAVLTVWSDGPALEDSVEQHLFEPFFSSESRSSGLGLYICRELCERHGGSIGYRRGPAPAGGGTGNAFFVVLRAASGPGAPDLFARIGA